MPVQLRDYQQDAVRAVVQYFRRMTDPAVVVLPTGAGKSLVIAELARLARGAVMVLAHVKELVEQNHQKYQNYGLEGRIFAAGLGRKENVGDVIFASVQSVHRNMALFTAPISLLVIDECHRVPDDEHSSYRQVIQHLQQQNPSMKVLGLTATPYRLNEGWLYQYHYRGRMGADAPRFFRWCIFELPIQLLLSRGYLTPARKLDCAVLSYDFSGLTATVNGHFRENELDLVIDNAKRVTPQIIEQIQQFAKARQGVMIFAATSRHAHEIFGYLPASQTALILSSTSALERAQLIQRFKDKTIKYLVNVAVLTTGFDAPHVDVIAILRPTESVSLYQQIVGRGLRLAEGKSDCLVLDYAGNPYDLYQPEIGVPPAHSTADQVTVVCPLCQFANQFWGKTDAQGIVIEHYGRKCQGLVPSAQGDPMACGYRFRARFCPNCGTEHDIAARHCHACDTVLVDPDKKLRDALALKDAMVVYPDHLQLQLEVSPQQKTQLKFSYQVGDQWFHEWFPAHTPAQVSKLCRQVLPPFIQDRHRPFVARTARQVLAEQHRFSPPQALILRKDGRYWKIRDRLFELTDFASFKPDVA